MNRIKTILISLAALAAATPATRADELSDLVAAVAASVQKEQMARDAAPNLLDKGKPRYPSGANQRRQNNLNQADRRNSSYNSDLALLDGIFSAMKRKTYEDMRRDLFGVDSESRTGEFQLSPGRTGELTGIPRVGLPRTSMYRPDFFRPVPGAITSLFGWRERFHRVHHGVDLALHVGDTVRAAFSGTVDLIAYDHDGYGHYVKMTHPDGMETLYGHLEYPLVEDGQFVYAGQAIGIGGNTGNSTGPHLHFEARLGGVAVDPLLLFDFDGEGGIFYAMEEMTEEQPATPKAPTYSHQDKSLKQEQTYIVRYGDTPESVARQAGISVMRLCQLNMLSQTDPLPVGRMLKLR